MSDKFFGWARHWGWGAVVAGALASALVVGCGGGGSSGAPAASATAAAYTNGPVSGFGSIIVNGVRFDDSMAAIEDEDGNRSSSASLKLGMMVEVESERVDDSAGRAKALRIRFGSEITGPVASVTADSFIVLGQTVEVRSATVFDDSLVGGLPNLAGKTVEVHALFDAGTGHYIATRVEDAAGAALFKLRGLVSALDPLTQTFQIGDAVISYASLAPSDLPPNFADGLRVRVRLQTTQVDGKWVAVTIRSGVRKVEDHDDARLRGTVTAFDSPTSFAVNGIPVDASAARIDNGPVVLGARVEVRGSAKEGTIIATRVKVLREDDDEVCGVELHGAVSDVNTDTNTFMLRGTKVGYSDTTVFMPMRSSESLLVNGSNVEVKGVLSADRSTLTAVLIKFEN